MQQREIRALQDGSGSSFVPFLPPASSAICTARPRFCEQRTSLVAASFLMFSISLALFFLPIVGSFIGGFIGGYKLGVVRKALVAALMPSFVVAAAGWLTIAALDVPMSGLLAAAGLAVVLAFINLGVATGATLGALANPGASLPSARLERG